MTRGSNRKLVPSPKKVARLLCAKALVNQFNVVTTSLLTCTIHVALVAMSPSGGKQQLCDSLVLATCAYSVTPLAGGAEGAPGFACPGARAAAAFLAAT